MINYFKAFSEGHILMTILSIVYGFMFLRLGFKYDGKYDKYNRIFFVLFIIIVRGIRYVYDVQIGIFRIVDLFSFHFCHISAITLIVVFLINKYHKWVVIYLTVIGLPATLSVILTPVYGLPEPFEPRAKLFILYHGLIAVGIIYVIAKNTITLGVQEFVATQVMLFGIAGISAVVNKVFDTNYLYLVYPPEGTFLEDMYLNMTSHLLYLLVIFLLAFSIISVQFVVAKIILDIIDRRKNAKEQLAQVNA